MSFGSFANNIIDPFWQQSFNDGFPTAWSTGDATGQGVLWARCDNPNTCPPAIHANLACSDTEFRSLGFEDGYMFVNSFQHGPLVNPSQSYLRTELIDCEDKTAVFIQFQTYIHAVYKDPDMNAVLRVRSGNGPWTTFSIFPNLNTATMESLQSWNAQPVLIDISSAAANKTNVTIEWNWTANFDVAWMIDDVAMFDSNPTYDNVVWGQIPGQGDFWGSQNGWTVVNNQLDSCKWVWVDNGIIYLADNNPKADALACWPGVDNGAMIMNASFCNRYGNSSLFSRSDLRSPAINLSGIAAGTKLDLKFNQAVAVANQATTSLPITSVAVSIDNGLTFIDTIEANPIQPYLHGKCGEVSFRLPAGVAGKPQVRLHFIFSGDIHYWMVDDVRIALTNDRDLAINPAFFNVAPDFSVPGSQVRPISLFAQIKNAGNLGMDGVTVVAEVKTSGNSVVFQDSVVLGTIEADEEWTDVFFPNKFLPSSQPEDYRIFYRLKASEPDQFAANNQVHWEYHVTDGVFSKNEFCSRSVGYFLPTESVAYEIGNCYFIPKGSNLKATTMNFAFKNVPSLANANVQLSIYLYKWKKGSNQGDVNADTIANIDEYEVVAYNLYEITGDENDQVVTVPVSGEFDHVDLEDDTYYFVTVGYLEPAISQGNFLRFPIAGSEEVNYTAMFYNSYQDGIPAYTSMLREEDDTDFRANAWALQRIPFVNLNVEFASPTNQLVHNPLKISLQPNPANELVQLSGDFSVNEPPIQVEILDICGRLVLRREFENRIVSQLPIDVSGLSNGSYTLRVISGDNRVSEKLMVLH
ncbi:MAG: T9SS type A sorting domain-containing protein [Saprospiraceae bacterium]|nr:T9SS type A sorting domain-containing protein [Saprospiraceae bacterium]